MAHSDSYPTSIRYLNKDRTGCERTNFSNWWKEEIGVYGQDVYYYVNTYSLTGADNVYGEQPSATYLTPVKMTMMVDLSQTSLIFSKFGLMGDDDITAVIHIDTFTSNVSSVSSSNAAGYEPKAGDVFQLWEYGNDRPGDRNGKYFEITERLDQEVSQINPLMGHYIWLLKGKRLDFSWEPGLSGENSPGSYPSDDNFSGLLSGFTQPTTPTNPTGSTSTADTSANDNFSNPYDGVYGDY
jgi:hypothetical protein